MRRTASPRHRAAGPAAALLAAAVLTAGCGAGSSGGGAASSSRDAATRYAATPPAAATMICSDEIRGEIADALNLPSVPAGTPNWTNHVYTCTYALPPGRLVLAVTVAPSDAAAVHQLETAHAGLGSAEQEPGLGERAYSTTTGTVIAVKDNLGLTVDARALPDDLGATHEKRQDFARVVAAGVFNCWRGNS